MEWPRFLPQREHMITPELDPPNTPAAVGSGHDWKLINYAHLFWLIPRDDSEEKWNCEVFNIDVTQAHALQHRGSSGTARAIARAFSVAVPALRNTRAIAKGDKVVLKWPKPKAVAKPPRTGTTWFSKSNQQMKRQKLRHPSDQGGLCDSGAIATLLHPFATAGILGATPSRRVWGRRFRPPIAKISGSSQRQ